MSDLNKQKLISNWDQIKKIFFGQSYLQNDLEQLWGSGRIRSQWIKPVRKISRRSLLGKIGDGGTCEDTNALGPADDRHGWGRPD